MRIKLTVILLLILIGTTAVCLAAQNMGPKEISLAGGSRGNVPFPHLTHQNKLGDCNVCHSLFPQTMGGIEKLKTDGKLKAKQVMNKHCIKCHKAEKKAGNTAGPTTCNSCHVRK